MRLMCEKLEENNHFVGENYCKPHPCPCPTPFWFDLTLKNECRAASVSGQE